MSYLMIVVLNHRFESRMRPQASFVRPSAIFQQNL